MVDDAVFPIFPDCDCRVTVRLRITERVDQPEPGCREGHSVDPGLSGGLRMEHLDRVFQPVALGVQIDWR